MAGNGLQRFNSSAGDWNAFNNGLLNGGGLQQLASSLLNDSNSANSKLIESYIKKISDESKRLSKQSISDAQRIKKIREESELEIRNILNKSIKTRLDALEQERKFAEMTAKQQGEYIVNQRKAIEEKKAALEDEKNIIAEKLKEIEKSIEINKGNKEQSEILEKAREDLEKRKADFLEREAENIADEKYEKLKLKNSKSIRAAEKKDEQDKRKQQTQDIMDVASTLGASISKEDRKTVADNSLSNLADSIQKTFSLQGLGKIISDGIKAFAAAGDAAFKEAEDILNTYQAVISTRLEGSGREYKDITQMLRRNLTLSPIIEQKKVLENVGRMVEQGIAYNLEQRAFLATVSEEIKSTFDAFDANLLRLIRLQREDSSYARMGLETSLTRLFNEYFLDSSYMSKMYDDIAGTLLDVTSTLSTSQSAEFEYMVQKWLGAMYSMGASSSFVTQVASGLNMLGTGNVEGLANSPMQTLFAMAANRTSTDYASLLTGGLNAQNTNELLKAMVEYLAEISGNTKSNKVVAGAYSNLFNMTLSDMRAIQNLSNDIDSIYSSEVSYSQMGGITNQRLTTLGDNYSLGKRIKTLFNNVMFSSAQTLVEDPVTYLLYNALNMVGSMGEPEVQVAPWGMGMSFKITDLMKDAMFGMSMLGNITGALGQMNSENGNELMNWTTQGEMRGSSYNLSARSGISQSYAMSGSGSDIETQSLQSGAEKTKETTKTIKGGEEEEEEVSIYDLYYGLFDNTNKEGAVSVMNRNVSSISNLLSSSYSNDAQAQRVVIAGWNMGDSEGSFELPVKFGSTGKQQMKSNMADVAFSLKGSDDATLLTILTLIVNTLAENNAINVNLASSSLPITDFVTGNGTPEKTAELPKGGGFVTPASTGGFGRSLANEARQVSVRQ